MENGYYVPDEDSNIVNLDVYRPDEQESKAGRRHTAQQGPQTARSTVWTAARLRMAHDLRLVFTFFNG